MFSRIYQILVQFLGESKQGSYRKDTFQYQFCCPRCSEENGGIPDGKFNLEINFQKQIYRCWKCCDTDGTQGRISKLIKQYGGTSLYRDYKEEMDSLIKSRLYNMDGFEASGITISDEVCVRLPETFTKIENINTCPDYRVKNYLNSRHITQDIISKYNIGYTTWEDESYYARCRIVVPSYDAFGELNYWSARDFTGKAKAKYKNCDSDKLDIIFQESLIDWDADIILCEGTFDILGVPNAISMLGKTLSRESLLCQTLKDKANGRVIIALDGDTDISETKKIYNLLNCGRLKDRVYYLEFDKEKDFADVWQNEGHKGIIKLISNIKQFDEIDLVL